MGPPKPVAVHSSEAVLTTAALPAMDAAHLTMTQAAKLRPSPTVPGSMEAAVKMWLQVGNIQKLQQVITLFVVIFPQLPNKLLHKGCP